MSMKLVRRVSIALALAAAPAAAQPDKQAPAEVTPSEASAWIGVFDKVVDTVVANREDCAKMASDLNVVVDSNKTTIAMAKDAKAKGKKLPTSAQQHMVDGARKMMGSLDKCGRDQKVGAAFARIDLGGRR